MKQSQPFLCKIILFIFLFSFVHAQGQNPQEDTIVVQTFTYGSPLRGWFQFPPKEKKYRKVWLYYKLKCDQGTTQDNYPCGEWDYLTYTFLYDHTGKMDSTLFYQANYKVKGNSPDSFAYVARPTWILKNRAEVHSELSDTQNMSIIPLGSSQIAANIPFSNNYPSSRSYFLWTASELSNAGMQAGKIQGIQLRIAATGSPLHRLKIAAAQTALDSLYEGISLPPVNTLYERNTTLSDTGWQTFLFHTPLDWDGQSNLLLSFSFNNSAKGQSNPAWLDNSGLGKSLVYGWDDHFLFFKDNDYVKIPAQSLSGLDKEISISVWVKGNPVFQPQNDYLFEAKNSAGQRVLNVHFPWSNGRIYWDAGQDGSGYDRIDKAATTPEYEGTWNHWVFTKNASSGIMRIYKNGVKWHEGSGKNRSMSGVTEFILGANTQGTGNFDGSIDEFAVWDTILSDADISLLSSERVSRNMPASGHLLLYYPFDEDQYPVSQDQSGNGFDGQMFGLPGLHRLNSEEINREMQATNFRPVIRYFQGNPMITHQNKIAIDSNALDPLSLVLFDIPDNPAQASDTLIVWEPGMTYAFDSTGKIIDSIPAPADTVLHRVDRPYYGTPFEIVNRFELLRYITPYGIGLDLGAQGDGEGFTWKIDVTDFAPLLADSVELSAGNNQEFLDMKFVMIEGTPPRDVQRIENVYNGSHRYDAQIESDFLVPKTFQSTVNEKGAKLRLTNTGHGFGGNLNCSEFCPTNNDIKVNSVKRYGQFLWRDNCNMNPVFPQGGTWIYSRSNWCPGAEVYNDEYELTPFYTPGDSFTIDYDMQSGYVWNGQGSTPYWRVEAQLITYGAPNFENDAEVEMIISPNKWEYYKRFNPICSNPVVRIRNSGSKPLTSVRIQYGVKNGEMHSYEWTGNLAFMESEEVTLPLANFGSWDGKPVFIVRTENPNGVKDDHPQNDEMETEFDKVPIYPSTLILWLRTNNAGNESYYRVFDQEGNVVKSGDNFNSNTLYKDTIRLDTGCYRFVLYDRGGDGLSFFANNDGTGFARLMDGFSTIKQFQPNFGAQIAQSFTVGYPMKTETAEESKPFRIFPNPGSNALIIQGPSDLFLTQVSVYSGKGALIYQGEHSFGLTNLLKINCSEWADGIYLIKMSTKSHNYTETFFKVGR